MKKVTIILTGVILMALNAINVNAQNTDDANALVSATILQHLQVNKTTDLAFGGIITDEDGGTVVIAANSSGSATYNGLPTQLPATTTAAFFTATGQADATFAIDLPTSITLTDGTNTMTVDDFMSSVGIAGVQLTSGSREFYVGATLNIGSAQPAGVYNGNFDVTVTYE